MSDKLFTEFEVPSYEQWQETAVSSLKGRPLEKLTSQTPEGIPVSPIYRQDDIDHLAEQLTSPGQFPYTRGTSANPAPWQIGEHFFDTNNPDQLNQLIKQGISQGQTAIHFGFADDNNLDSLQRIFAGIDMKQLSLYWFSNQPLTQAAMLATALSTPLQGGLLNDPLAELVLGADLPLEQIYEETAVLFNWMKIDTPNFTPLAVLPNVYHEAGANAVQELAFMLAAAVFHIRQLQQHHLDINRIATATRAGFGVSGDIFANIAKLRAARRLWAQMISAFDGSKEAQKLKLIAFTAQQNKSSLVPHNNLLRLTAETFAAAVGGAEVIFTRAFDDEFSTPNQFARHLSNNIQHILQQEVGLTNLVDPAGGAYYVEYLTDALAQKAWSLFQQIEAEGGMLTALQSGMVQDLVKETAVSRQSRLAHRRDVLVGVNRYPVFGERYSVSSKEFSEMSSVPQNEPPKLADAIQTMEEAIVAAKSGATVSQITAVLWKDAKRTAVEFIDPEPLHAAFETLRTRSDNFAKQNGRFPQLFAINLGDLPRHKPRTEFAREFLGVGGFELLDEGRWKTAESAATATLASSADAAIICGHDDDYPELVPEIARLLKGKRPFSPLLLAGYPKQHIEAFQAAGIDQFVHLSANYLEINQWLQEKIIGRRFP